MLLADYSGRLAAEIDDRRQLTRLLALFLQSQRDGLTKNEQKLEVRIPPISLTLLSNNVRHSRVSNSFVYLPVKSFFHNVGFFLSTRGQH